MLTRIDAEEGLMPPDGAVMINAVDVLKSRAPTPGEPPILYGMPAAGGDQRGHRRRRRAVRRRRGPVQDRRARAAVGGSWPTVQRKLRTHPLLVLSGFSPLVARAQLDRDGRAVRLHLAVSRDETLRLLAMAAHFMTGRFGNAPQ